MKKILIVCLLLFSILLSACGNNSSQNTTNTVTEASTQAEPTKSIIETNSINEDYATITIGETISTDFTEIELINVSIDFDVYPKDTSGVFLYYPGTEGKQYFQLIGNLKNTFTNMYEVNNIVVHFTFDDKYEYDGYVVADSGLFEAYDYQVDPFETVDIHLMGEIPDDLINSFHKCIIEFGFGENFQKVKSMDSCEYKYRVEYIK